MSASKGPRDPKSPAVRLSGAIRLADAIATSCPHAKGDALRLRALLTELRKDFVGMGERPATRPRPVRTISAYSVEQSGHEEVLAEYRSSRRHPFLCPAPVVRETAMALERKQEPIKAPEILKAVQSHVHARVPGHQVRLALRFLVKGDLVVHSRARYLAAGQPGHMKADLDALWERVRQAEVASGRKA